jgi:DNA-binding response OmpR family regulator
LRIRLALSRGLQLVRRARFVRVLVVQSAASGMPFIEELVSLAGRTIAVRSEREVVKGTDVLWDADLVVFARRVWSEDALAVVTTLRGSASPSPLLIVSGPCTAESRVKAFVSGADEFLYVPFAVEEFAVRARALVRRGTRLRHGPLLLDPLQRVALLEDRPLSLTAREFDIVLALVRRAGEAVTYAELMRVAERAETSLQSNWLNVHINRIRQKLGRHAHVLQTVRGMGYRLRSREP